MEISHRDLFNDMAEHMAILKNVQNTYLLRFSFIPKTDKAFLKMGILFLLWVWTRSTFAVRPLGKSYVSC